MDVNRCLVFDNLFKNCQIPDRQTLSVNLRLFMYIVTHANEHNHIWLAGSTSNDAKLIKKRITVSL